MINEPDNKSIEVIDKVLINEPDNKTINEPDNKSINKLDNSSINESDNNSINELDNSSINKEINSNLTSWYDTDKLNKILAAIENNNFNHKNKIGKLKFNEINDLINSIKGNTISEADVKKKINELNEIKKVEIKGKRLIENQKKLLSLFDDLLKAIFNETVIESNSSTKNKTVNESNSSIKNESKSDNENDSESDNESNNEGKKDTYYYEIRQLNS